MSEVKRFNVTCKQTETFNANVASLFIRSDASFKGNVETITDLKNLVADDGDYADVFETNSRWEYQSGEWHNTDKYILINPLVVKQSEVSVEAILDTVVKRDEYAGIRIAAPILPEHATNMLYVDGKFVELENMIPKLVRENKTIATSEWMELTDKSPYKFYAKVLISETLNDDSVVEVAGLNLVTQSNYGIAPVEETDGQNLILYAITQPTENIGFIALIRRTSEVIG